MSPRLFRHEAMATHFEITIAGQTEDYARQAADAAWRDLDRLEGELSRYVESSDIARANRIGFGETISIGDDALNCLLLAAALAEATGHAFDPAYGSSPAEQTLPGQPLYTLDPEGHRLTSRAARLHLDLGAVGKGFALDRLAESLSEWSIASALLNSGGSTVLALAPPPSQEGWRVGIGEGGGRRELLLSQCALSGSGLAVKGAHLVDPRTGAPATRSLRAWAQAECAAIADALSTAFFVMTDDGVRTYCAAHPEIGAALQKPDGGLDLLGSLGLPQVGPGAVPGISSGGSTPGADDLPDTA
jgi:thiamine biosynthesis lipoprotein